ncbi:MAG: hypothetical protein ACRDIC_15695 [bacterium]
MVSSPPGSPIPSRRGVILATLLAGGASLLLVWLPLYATATNSYSIGPDGGGVSTSSVGRATLLDVNGAGALVGLVLPLALAVASLLVPGTRWVRVATGLSAAALVGFVVLSGFSIGLFYVPSAIAMVVAAGQQTRARAAA